MNILRRDAVCPVYLGTGLDYERSEIEPRKTVLRV
jgi:hypothetical protein